MELAKKEVVKINGDERAGFISLNVHRLAHYMNQIARSSALHNRINERIESLWNNCQNPAVVTIQYSDGKIRAIICPDLNKGKFNLGDNQNESYCIEIQPYREEEYRISTKIYNESLFDLCFEVTEVIIREAVKMIEVWREQSGYEVDIYNEEIIEYRFPPQLI